MTPEQDVAGIRCTSCYTLPTFTSDMLIDMETHKAFVAAHSANKVEREAGLKKLGVIKGDSEEPGAELASTKIFQRVFNELSLVLHGCKSTGGISTHGNGTVCSCQRFWPDKGECSHQMFVRVLAQDPGVNLAKLFGMTQGEGVQTRETILQRESQLRARSSNLPAPGNFDALRCISMDAANRTERRAEVDQRKRKLGATGPADMDLTEQTAAAKRAQKAQVTKRITENWRPDNVLWHTYALNQILIHQISGAEVSSLNCGIFAWLNRPPDDADVEMSSRIRKILDMWKEVSEEKS